MIELVWDPGFKRSYRKLIKNNQNIKTKFIEKIKLFSENPFDIRLKTHKLSGQLKDYWAFSIDYNCRIVFRFINDNKILLVEIGSHQEVY